MAENKNGEPVNGIGRDDAQREQNERIARSVLSGERKVTPESIETDGELAKLLADALLEDELRRESEELKALDGTEEIKFSAEFESKMDKLFRKDRKPAPFRLILRKAAPYAASAAAILIFCSLALFSFLNSDIVNTLLRRPSNIPGFITEPVTVSLSEKDPDEIFVSLYNDGYYADETGSLSEVDDLLKSEAQPSELPLYRNPLPRPFGPTADIGLGYYELRSYSLKLADIISGSPETLPTLLDTEETALYLKMTFEGYSLRASRYGYIDLIPDDPQLYSTEEKGVMAAVEKFLEDYPISRPFDSDEALTLAKETREDEYTVYFAAADTVRNAINRDLHEICVTLQDGMIVSCRIKITDFLLEDMEMKPVTGLDAAKARLLSDSRFGINSETDIAAADLVYLSGADFEYFYPAYRFYVAVSDNEAVSEGYGDEVDAGYKVYRLIQIPAVELVYPNT